MGHKRTETVKSKQEQTKFCTKNHNLQITVTISHCLNVSCNKKTILITNIKPIIETYLGLSKSTLAEKVVNNKVKKTAKLQVL